MQAVEDKLSSFFGKRTARGCDICCGIRDTFTTRLLWLRLAVSSILVRLNTLIFALTIHPVGLFNYLFELDDDDGSVAVMVTWLSNVRTNFFFRDSFVLPISIVELLYSSQEDEFSFSKNVEDWFVPMPILVEISIQTQSRITLSEWIYGQLNLSK